jgi:hypothetical protein
MSTVFSECTARTRGPLRTIFRILNCLARNGTVCPSCGRDTPVPLKENDDGRGLLKAGTNSRLVVVEL